ncbi:hypothetical protein crov255 [Cafeteria roenbergensis virus]|uniref:Uncharacterized protein n=1 Tax=Cafeteria roenbergensis virus (strain BV-PW1) TaxID=693272 RepID=E3T525_CROVB|nr:hypothetical protein crov255 [Cafeteria roenbergensis virus BV-PW1]ADO67288.1 hypothetical protein crov255 [Cafeteria roenbergensis virus BV-PW1]
MKIDFVLTAGNLNDHYLNLYPLIFKVWKERFNLNCYLILIAHKIPDYLVSFKDFIILFKPLENINDIYIAQVIRILYPALYPDKTVLITDLDILPGKKDYFLKPIESLHEDTFVTYTDRYSKQEMYAICYNVGKGLSFQKMFNIKNINDIILKLKEWYNIEYTGKKNCPGWYTDQKQLYINFKKYQGNKVVLQDKKIGYNRLNNRARDKEYIIKNFTEIMNNLGNYSDIHCIKPFHKTKGILNKIVKNLILLK